MVQTGRAGADNTRGESRSGKHWSETVCEIPDGWSQHHGAAICHTGQHSGSGTQDTQQRALMNVVSLSARWLGEKM